MGVIVGFNRRRDSYQAPLAFAEAGLLDRFVTDVYWPDRWPALPVLSTRHAPGLPSRLVTRAPRAFLRQAGWEVQHRLRSKNVRFPSQQVDSAIGVRIAAVAERHPASSLLVYSGYAFEAFARRTNARRTLFQFHPTAAVLHEAICADELEGARPWMIEPEATDTAMNERIQREIETATSFVVASSVTKRGLVLDGVAPDLVDVVPYGADVDPAAPPPLAPLERCRFLYVGQGVQRKGLHLLLEAWRRGRPAGARLTIVAIRMDPEIRAMLGGLDDVTVHAELDAAALRAEFDAADTVVVPSVLEGFGLVLLEGLARGCRLIGSTNTGLPDLELPDTIASTVEAGSVESLRRALERAADTFQTDRPYARVAWQHALQHSWADFRQRLRSAQTRVPA